MPQDEKAAIAGFFGEFDFEALANKAGSLKSKSPSNPVLTPEPPAQSTSLRQIVRSSDYVTQVTSDSVTENASEPVPLRRSDDPMVKSTEGQYVTSPGPLTQNTPDSHYVTTSLRQAKPIINTGVTRGQLPILKWLVQVCGNQEVVITYKMASAQLKVTERAVRTHIESLNKKGLIIAHTAHRPNSLQPIGKAVRITHNAHLALALTQSNGRTDVLTENESVRQYVTPSVDQPQFTSDSQTVRPPDRHTYSSSSYKTTTTAFEENSDEEGDRIFDKLYLDEWEQWGLRPKMIHDHLQKDITLLQNILDKTAYVIKQKEGTQFAIQRKIGFLNKCLDNEICEVDNGFVYRKEKLLILKNKQKKEEIARIQRAQQELEQSTVELLRSGLSGEELEEVKLQAINDIKSELKSETIHVSEAQRVSYENRILLSIAKQRGML